MAAAPVFQNMQKPRAGVAMAATGPLVGANAGGALWAVLAAAAAVGQVLENRTRWGASVSAPLLTMGVTIALAWTGVIPTSAPTYELVWSNIMPLAVCLFLLETDVRKVFSDAGTTLKAFVLGAVGTVLGTVVGFALVGRWMGSDGWKMAACLCASYVGGSINYAATAQALGVASGASLAAGMAADNLAMAAYFGVLMSWPTGEIPDNSADAASELLDASEPTRTASGKATSRLAGGSTQNQRLWAHERGGSGRSDETEIGSLNDTWREQEERRQTAAEASVSGRGSGSGRVGGFEQGLKQQRRIFSEESAPSEREIGTPTSSERINSLAGATTRETGTNAVRMVEARSLSDSVVSLGLEQERQGLSKGPGQSEESGSAGRSERYNGGASSNGTGNGTGNGNGNGNGARNGQGALKTEYGLKERTNSGNGAQNGTASCHGTGIRIGNGNGNGVGNGLSTRDAVRETGAVIAAGFESATDGELEWRARPSAESVSLSLAAAAVSCAAGQALAAALPPAFAGTELALMAVIASLISIAVGHVTSGGKESGPHIAAFAGAETMGGALMQIFFAVVGATASLQEAINGGWPLLVFILTLLTVHVAFIAVLGSKVFRLPIRSVLIASNANVGGPATAAAMASAKGWPEMVRGALLTGTLGYTVGTAIGCLVGALLRGM